MKDKSVKVSKRWRITLPAGLRKGLNIKCGDHLLIDIQAGMVLLIPAPASYTQHLAGIQREIWGNIDVQEYITRERQAWESTP